METSGIDRAVAVAAAPEAAERREGKRHTAVLLIGRADFGGREHACLVHNISERGVMARFLTPPRVGEVLSMQLRGLGPAEATVRWIKGPCAGMEFAQPQELSRVLHPPSPGELRPRTPRFDLRRAACVEIDGEAHEAVMVDISVGGAKLVSAPPMKLGAHALLRLVGTKLCFAGAVCWQHGDRAGFKFVTALTLQKLADVLDSAGEPPAPPRGGVSR